MILCEMITKFLHFIESVFKRIRPQNRIHTNFAKQEEFGFVLTKTPGKKSI